MTTEQDLDIQVVNKCASLHGLNATSNFSSVFKGVKYIDALDDSKILARAEKYPTKQVKFPDNCHVCGSDNGYVLYVKVYTDSGLFTFAFCSTECMREFNAKNTQSHPP